MTRTGHEKILGGAFAPDGIDVEAEKCELTPAPATIPRRSAHVTRTRRRWLNG